MKVIKWLVLVLAVSWVTAFLSLVLFRESEMFMAFRIIPALVILSVIVLIFAVVHFFKLLIDRIRMRNGADQETAEAFKKSNFVILSVLIVIILLPLLWIVDQYINHFSF